MKKIIAVIAGLIMILSLVTSCTKNNVTAENDDKTIEDQSTTNNAGVKQDQTEHSATENNNTENTDEAINNKLSIVTTIFPQYDFTRQIVGDKADVTMLLKPGLDGHSYEPTPQDIKTIQTSDLFIYTGGENDTWVDGIIESMGDNAPETMKLIDLVNTVDEEIIEGMQHNHVADPENEKNNEHVHEVDEHVWTSPINAILIVEQITDVLSEKDPSNAEFFSANSMAYIEQLEALDQQIKDVVEHAERKILLFGDRFPFRYFADEYNLEYYAAFTGCSADTEASAATVAFLIDKVNELHLPVVFSIEFSNEKIADSIVEATAAEKLTFHSIHNLSVEELAAHETYLSLMEKNIEVLEKALN